ncbi:MAG: calcium-binding protein, partial [Pseudomonadota bacterium]
DDSLLGGSGDDLLQGGSGDDTLDGGAGCDTLIDGNGDDLVFGGAEADLFLVGDGADTLDGGTGDDTFLVAAEEGGLSENVIEGGSGKDYAHYGEGSGSDSFADTISDSSGGFVLNVSDLGDVLSGADLTLTFIGDADNGDEEDDDGDDENEGFIFEFLIDGKTVTETIVVGDVADATDADEIATAVFDALESRGYSVQQDQGSDTVTIEGFGGSGIAVNDITKIGSIDIFDEDNGPPEFLGLEGFGLVVDQGAGEDLDLIQASMLGVTRVNLNQGDIEASIDTFDYDDLEVRGAGGFDEDDPGEIDFNAKSDDGELVENRLEDENLDVSSALMRQDGNVDVDGGAGNDTLRGNESGWGEEFDGNDGDDVIEAGGGEDLVFAGSGDDSVDGGSGNDVIGGNEGDDTLNGGSGKDTLLGGSGDDVIILGDGEAGIGDGLAFSASLDEEADEEDFQFSFSLDAGDMVVIDLDNGFIEGSLGGDDSETVSVPFDYSMTLFGPGSGDDLGPDIEFSDDFLAEPGSPPFGGSGIDDGPFDGFFASPDPFIAMPEIDEDGTYTVVVEAEGPLGDADFDGETLLTFDLLVEQVGSQAYGGDGDDTITGGDGRDTIEGGQGDDSILGGDGSDDLRGDGFFGPLVLGDIFVGDEEFDTDLLEDLGVFEEDFIIGFTEGGDDYIDGQGGNDFLRGDFGNDTLIGGDGDDILESGFFFSEFPFGSSGFGADELTGGDGADLFRFIPAISDDPNTQSRPTEPGPDCITDFSVEEGDRIDLLAFIVEFEIGGISEVDTDENNFLVVEEEFDSGDSGNIELIVVDGDTQVIVDLDDDGRFSQDDLVFILKDFEANDDEGSEGFNVEDIFLEPEFDFGPPIIFVPTDDLLT